MILKTVVADAKSKGTEIFSRKNPFLCIKVIIFMHDPFSISIAIVNSQIQEIIGASDYVNFNTAQ
jgi:hypothetical protein